MTSDRNFPQFLEINQIKQRFYTFNNKLKDWSKTGSVEDMKVIDRIW